MSRVPEYDPDPERSAADHSLYRAWEMLCERSPIGDVEWGDGTLFVHINVQVPFFNCAFITAPPGDRAGAIERAQAFFGSRGVPWLFRIRDGVDPKMETLIVEAGFGLEESMPAFVMSPIPEAPPPVDGLRIERVTTPELLEVYNDVVARGFAMPRPVADALLDPVQLEVEEIALYLGLHGDEAVATSSLFQTDGVAGIYTVATPPEHRRKGFGEALTWHAVSEGARAGSTLATLQASVMGRPIYERMGFRLVGEYRQFVAPTS